MKRFFKEANIEDHIRETLEKWRRDTHGISVVTERNTMNIETTGGEIYEVYSDVTVKYTVDIERSGGERGEIYEVYSDVTVKYAVNIEEVEER